MTKSVEVSDFAMEIDKILRKVEVGANERTVGVITKGVRRSASAWRRNAKDLRWDEGDHTYKKHGKVYTTGKYVRSIKSHMVDKSPEHPMGESGTPSMPGLGHLLEDGHVIPGGGFVRGQPHIRPAAKEAFDYTIDLMEREIGKVLDDV
jgi:hypothetical protein